MCDGGPKVTSTFKMLFWELRLRFYRGLILKETAATHKL
jgi:hypothetical protein